MSRDDRPIMMPTPMASLKAEPAPPPVDTRSPEQRIAALGIVLPQPAAPVAAYVPAVQVNGLLHVSGQLPFENGHVMVGRVGDDRDIVYATNAARACGIMLLAQIQAALGSLSKVQQIVKLGVFINSDPRFADQPKVANGASELMVEIFGEAGKHARSAVGVPILPLGAIVEVDAIVAVRPD